MKKKVSQKKQKIVEATLSLVRNKGYDGVSVNDISEAVGLSKSGMFAHFRNKEEMINEALKLSISQLSATLSHRPEQTGIQGFEAMLRAIADYLKVEKKCVGLHLLYGSSGEAGVINNGLREFFLLLKASLSQSLYQQDSTLEACVVEQMVEDIIAQLEGATIWLLLDDNPDAIDRAVTLGMERVRALIR